MKHQTNLALSCVVAATLFVASKASATPVTLGGLTFFEQSGDFTITSGSGTGSLADPFVIHETVTGLDVTIGIRGLSLNFGNPAGTGHATGFRLTKVILNATGGNWTFYDNELQETLGLASANGDGLSFAQGSANQRPFVGNPMGTVSEELDLRDYVNFSGGVVLPGESLTITYSITDNTPISLFYLRQRPNVLPTGERVPDSSGTALLLGFALVGLAPLVSRAKSVGA